MPAALARELAELAARRGLLAPARLLVDAHRPLGPLVADLAVAFAPLGRAIGGSRVAAYAGWLEGPDALDELEEALEEQEQEGDRRADAG